MGKTVIVLLMYYIMVYNLHRCTIVYSNVIRVLILYIFRITLARVGTVVTVCNHKTADAGPVDLVIPDNVLEYYVAYNDYVAPFRNEAKTNMIPESTAEYLELHNPERLKLLKSNTHPFFVNSEGNQLREGDLLRFFEGLPKKHNVQYKRYTLGEVRHAMSTLVSHEFGQDSREAAVVAEHMTHSVNVANSHYTDRKFERVEQACSIMNNMSERFGARGNTNKFNKEHMKDREEYIAIRHTAFEKVLARAKPDDPMASQIIQLLDEFGNRIKSIVQDDTPDDEPGDGPGKKPGKKPGNRPGKKPDGQPGGQTEDEEILMISDSESESDALPHLARAIEKDDEGTGMLTQMLNDMLQKQKNAHKHGGVKAKRKEQQAIRGHYKTVHSEQKISFVEQLYELITGEVIDADAELSLHDIKTHLPKLLAKREITDDELVQCDVRFAEGMKTGEWNAGEKTPLGKAIKGIQEKMMLVYIYIYIYTYRYHTIVLSSVCYIKFPIMLG